MSESRPGEPPDRSTSNVDGAVERWSEGLDEEIEFWHRWLRDRGGPWPEDYIWRTDPDSPLQPRVAAYLPDVPARRPLRAIEQMLRVVKPGRYVLLDHATDEGEFMDYAGPHQWNFRVEEGRFVIWRPDLRVDAHAVLEQDADIETAVATDDSRYMSVALRKHRPRRFGRVARLLRR